MREESVNPKAEKLAFGDCVLDVAARELTRAGQRVELSPKAFELLAAMIEARPRALSRAEIHDCLWPDTFVSEASLRQVVMELRRGLGDDPDDPCFVRTIRRYGYAFSGSVEPVGQPAQAPRPSRFSLLRGSFELPLCVGENLLGRDPTVAIRLTSEKASRRHARIVVTDGGALLEDLGSKNGTYLNGSLLESSVPLVAGDRIMIGRELLVFCGQADKSTQTDLEER